MGAPYQISRSAHGLDVSFMESALCHTEGHNRAIFFTDIGRSADERAQAMEAKSVCLRCPVNVDCFEYALAADEHGIWGGTTREERLHYRRWGRMPGPAPLIRRKGKRRWA